jgi:hypothetical protein
MGGIMSDCIDTVSSLMPSSSSFQGSDVEGILDQTIGEYFDEMEERIEDVLDAPFLTEASGDYLDLIHGVLYGVSRGLDEDDDDYRVRLSFQARDKVRPSDLRELDCGVYAFVDDFDSDYTLTSRNTSLTKKVLVEFPSLEVEELVKNNLLWEKVLVSV